MKPTRDEAVFMLAVLAGSADGVPQDEEAELIARRLAPQLARLGHDGRRRALATLTDLIDAGGQEATLAALRDIIPANARVAALRLATQVAFADGRLTTLESKHLMQLARLFGLQDADVAALLATMRR